MNGADFGESMGKAMMVLCVGCVALGAFIVWAAPKVWVWLKPLLHAATG